MIDFQGLLDGYRRFRSESWARERARWGELATGQRPQVMVIACSDSRVDPSQIFDTPPGAMFVVRNVAALVPPCETGGGYHGVSAALEFAVTQLEVPEILVMGHGGCGGCAASLSRKFADADHGKGGFIDAWIGMLADARAEVVAQHGDDSPTAQEALEHRAVRVSLANLGSFPFVASRLAAGRLSLHGAWFNIADGELHVLDEASGRFGPA